MNRRRRTDLICAIILLGISCAPEDKDAEASAAARGSVGPGSEQGTLKDPNVRAKLRDLALQASSGAGVAAPRTMAAAASPDHQVAAQLATGDVVNDHAPVYVIVMTGGPFTANASSHPPGVPAPQGEALTLIVDARTDDVTDVSYTAKAPDLTRIDSEVEDLLAESRTR